MKRGAIVGAFLIACMASIPRHTAAQQRPSLSVEATFGHVFGYTAGEYLSDRQGIGVDLMLGVRAGAVGKRGIVLGANASLYDGGPHTLICYPATTRDGCIQPFPFFRVAGALVGWENASTTLRVMGGPAWADAESDALAWQARLDGALPVVWRLALVGSIRGTVVPSYRGDAVRLFALGLGVRVR
jgi:hypothetical protein